MAVTLYKGMMKLKNRNLFIGLLILIGISGVFMLNLVFNKSSNNAEAEMSSIEEFNHNIIFNNSDELFNTVEDADTNTTILLELSNTIRYINIILQDMPKANSVNEYYDINKEAISNIYGLNTVEKFTDFYNLIEPLQILKKYEIVSGSIKNTASKYNITIKLQGEEEVSIPILINIKDASNHVGSSHWNKR